MYLYRGIAPLAMEDLIALYGKITLVLNEGGKKMAKWGIKVDESYIK